MAVLAGDRPWARQRERGCRCRSVRGRRHSMVPTMRWYAAITSHTICAAAHRSATFPSPSVRRSPWLAPVAKASARSHTNLGVPRRPSRTSYGAMRRRVVAAWSTVLTRRNGMLTVQQEGPRMPNW
jgi:hypothetical protein